MTEGEKGARRDRFASEAAKREGKYGPGGRSAAGRGVSMFLKGDRDLSKAQIKKLAGRFKVDAGVLVDPGDSGDFQTALLAGINTSCDAIGCVATVKKHSLLHVRQCADTARIC